MRRARKCAHRARPKSHMQMWLFLRIIFLMGYLNLYVQLQWFDDRKL